MRLLAACIPAARRAPIPGWSRGLQDLRDLREKAAAIADAQHKQLEAFSQTPLLDESGGKFLQLPRVLTELWRYSGKHEPLVYMRSCYGKILDLIWAHSEMSEVASVVVLGTPGIGKSGFLFVLLWELLHKHCWNLIILKFRESERYYAFDKDGKVSSTIDPVVAVTWVHAEEKCMVWYLADWKFTKNHRSLPCKTVIATLSEREQKHHRDDVIRLFVPTWSREEIHTLNDRVFKHPKAEVDDRFDKWGGIPRHVLSKTSIHQRQELEDAIHSVACAVCDSKRLFVANAGYASDLVYHITVKDDNAYAIATKKLATSYVIDKLAAFLNIDVLDRVLNYDRATIDSENSVYAEFFDRKFHLLLLHGCCALSVTMNKKGPSGPEEQAKSFIKAMDLMLIETEFPKDMTPEQLDHTVIKPKDCDNTDWDIICGRRVLQLMVSDKRRDEGLFPYGQRPGWTKAFDFLRSVYKDGRFTFSVTVHGETLGDTRLRIMNDYAAAGIEVTICCKPVHL
ncbi:hypothetical protein SELMODRAFT_406107 [Selaginella moellendorffii]|uniref:Uncharacterized protein n=1 Tax=Selaginella moellendorffii TaxID=88036 RepID=D8R0Q4_SELML|nr:hypothetical protein SELMODRAFT_406107 [Selaginella moellendorffii]